MFIYLFIKEFSLVFTSFFLKLASSALLKLTQDNLETNGSSSNGGSGGSHQNGASVLSQKELTNRDSVYIVLDQIVQSSPFLTYDLLDSCFPYALLRTSYRQILKQGMNSTYSAANGYSNSHFLIND
jgi:hypothetical protein